MQDVFFLRLFTFGFYFWSYQRYEIDFDTKIIFSEWFYLNLLNWAVVQFIELDIGEFQKWWVL